MKLATLLSSALLLATLTACGGSEAEVASQTNLPAPPASPAPQPRQTHMVEVPAGTVLTLALDTSLGSETAQAGDTFTATFAGLGSVTARFAGTRNESR